MMMPLSMMAGYISLVLASIPCYNFNPCPTFSMPEVNTMYYVERSLELENTYNMQVVQ